MLASYDATLTSRARGNANECFNARTGAVPIARGHKCPGRIYLAWNRNRFSALAYYTCASPATSAGRGWTRVGPTAPSRESAASGSERLGPPLLRIYCNAQKTNKKNIYIYLNVKSRTCLLMIYACTNFDHFWQSERQVRRWTNYWSGKTLNVCTSCPISVKMPRHRLGARLCAHLSRFFSKRDRDIYYLLSYLKVSRIIVNRTNLPRSGTTSDVGGMISASRRKNTVSDNRIEMDRLTCGRTWKVKSSWHLGINTQSRCIRKTLKISVHCKKIYTYFTIIVAGNLETTTRLWKLISCIVLLNRL